MRIATWNVNGIRARNAQVIDWIAARPARTSSACRRSRPGPTSCRRCCFEPEGYWCHWHGGGRLLGRGAASSARSVARLPPVFDHPPFDFETRVATVVVDGIAASPRCTCRTAARTTGQDARSSTRSARGRRRWWRADSRWSCAATSTSRTPIRICIRRSASLGRSASDPMSARCSIGCLDGGLVDVGAALDPDNDELFTWWAPWRNLRQRNIGWRIDYVLASPATGQPRHTRGGRSRRSAPATTRPSSSTLRRLDLLPVRQAQLGALELLVGRTGFLLDQVVLDAAARDSAASKMRFHGASPSPNSTA